MARRRGWRRGGEQLWQLLNFVFVNFCTHDFANNMQRRVIFVTAAAAIVDAGLSLEARVLFTEQKARVFFWVLWVQGCCGLQ